MADFAPAHVARMQARQKELLAYALVSGFTLLLAAVATGLSIAQIA